MEPWTANLIGAFLGLALGGAGLVVFLPYLEQQPASAPLAAGQTAASPSAPGQSAPQRAQVVQPSVDLPPVAVLPNRPGSLPNIIHPEGSAPDPSPPRSGSGGTAGTGFFVNYDGTVLTAAHVVNECRQTKIVSKFVKPAAVRLIAADTKNDIALLHADGVRPPAVLPIGRPASSSARLFVLGYPASAGPLVPAETWATLENDKLQPAPPELSDPRKVVWVTSPAIQHGYSGGPMIDPRNGEVVAIVKGLADTAHLHDIRSAIPATGVVIGPGSGLLTSFMHAQGTDDSTLSISGNDAIDTARRATVHVLCWQ